MQLIYGMKRIKMQIITIKNTIYFIGVEIL